jgi:type IV pilus assembly protein PilE
MNLEPLAARRRDRGFTLIDLVIAMAIIAVLLKIAFPSYQAYIVRSSRQSAQGELVALANLQEKIFLNSSAYTSSVVGAYTGQSTGDSVFRSEARRRPANRKTAATTFRPPPRRRRSRSRRRRSPGRRRRATAT